MEEEINILVFSFSKNSYITKNMIPRKIKQENTEEEKIQTSLKNEEQMSVSQTRTNSPFGKPK